MGSPCAGPRRTSRLTHHDRRLVVDGRAYILTFNLTPQYYASDRDFGVIDRDAADVPAIERTFAADWAHVGGSRAPDGR